ncbi:hypothetical protein D3C78_1535320 [compost metagenome]
MRGEEQQHRDRDADENIGGVYHPEHRRPAQHEITHRAAANAGRGCEKQEADQVELLARGGERAGCGKDGDAGIIEKT